MGAKSADMTFVGQAKSGAINENPAKQGVERGVRFWFREFAAKFLAETKGFEPLMQVYARMLP